MSTLIELDGRKRAALAALATKERYLADVDDTTGVITLTPAVVMTEQEVTLLGRTDILDLVAESRASNEDAGRPLRASR